MWVGLIQSVKKTLEKTTEVPPSEERGFLPLYLNCTINYQGFCGGSDGKESACNARDLGLIPESGRFLGRREWLPTPVFLPGEFQHGRVTKEIEDVIPTLERFAIFV